jgi:hypothetical protein
MAPARRSKSVFVRKPAAKAASKALPKGKAKTTEEEECDQSIASLEKAESSPTAGSNCAVADKAASLNGDDETAAVKEESKPKGVSS